MRNFYKSWKNTTKLTFPVYVPMLMPQQTPSSVNSRQEFHHLYQHVLRGNVSSEYVSILNDGSLAKVKFFTPTIFNVNITEYFIFCRGSAYKKLLEYLFWIWDPDLPGGQHEPRRVIQDGFMDPATCKVIILFFT